MKKLNIAVLIAIACAFATGCVKDVNSPSSVPQEPGTAEQPIAELNNGDDNVNLPTPEFVENGQDGNVIATPEPVPEPTPEPPAPIDSNLSQPKYAPLDADKWDIKLPKVELTPGNPKDEKTPEVEKKLAKALADIEAGELEFLEGQRQYGGAKYSSGNSK